MRLSVSVTYNRHAVCYSLRLTVVHIFNVCTCIDVTIGWNMQLYMAFVIQLSAKYCSNTSGHSRQCPRSKN